MLLSDAVMRRKREPQIPPLHFAAVGMTTSRWRKKIDPSQPDATGVVMRREAGTAGPSAPLRYGRDDNIEGQTLSLDDKGKQRPR
jgi:hypothetical protein